MSSSTRRSASASSDFDPLDTLFGITGADFRAVYARRQPIVVHGAAHRLHDALGNLFIRSSRDVQRLAPEYVYGVRRDRVGSDRLLGFEDLSADERARVTSTDARYYFFDNLDEHFQSGRQLVNAIARAVRVPPSRLSCRGCYHNPGARVPRHCDGVDVMTFQLFGTREWRIERNSDPPVGIEDPVLVPRMRKRRWDRAFTGESFLVQMRSGSALYVPRGWWHATHSPAASFSVIVSLPEPRNT